MNNNYFIKDDYSPRLEYIQFDDTGNTDLYQKEVYHRIREFFIDKNCSSIADIGCGSGYKLMNNFSDFTTVGYEMPETLKFLRASYPDGDWRLSDFSRPLAEKYDLIMSIDVIEHLLNPDLLINFLKESNFKYLALSTPERDLIKGGSCSGPPSNKHHVREWSFHEFSDYISQYFDILEHSVLSDHDQLIIAVPKTQ